MNLSDKNLSLVTGLGILFFYVVKYIKRLFKKVSYICIKTEEKKITFEDNKKEKKENER